MTQTHESLSATVLLKTAQSMQQGRAAFLQALNAELAPLNLAMEAEHGPGNGGLRLYHGAMWLSLSEVLSPCPTEDYAAALGAPITMLKPFDMANAVAGHDAHIHLDIGTTQSANALPIEAIVILHRAVATLCAMHEVQAVLWQRSDMLFRPEEIAAAADQVLPLSLFVHPLPLANPDEPGTIGFVASGSEAYCGKVLVLQPCALSIQQGLELISALMMGHLTGDIVLEDGAEIPIPGRGLVHLRHIAGDAGAPSGRILIGLNTPPAEQIAPPLAMATLPGAPGPWVPGAYLKASRAHPLSSVKDFLLSPKGLGIAAAIVGYLVLVQFINAWLDDQTDQIRAALERPAPITQNVLPRF